MRKILTAAVTLAFSICFSLADAQAQKKVALVIGNGAYKHAVELPNAPNDAREIANALRRMDFTVVEGIDLNYPSTQLKLREFARALIGAELGLFFYAGHGLQVAGENYLVPIESMLKREADLEFEAVKVDVVMRQLSREARIKVLILDSCRDNPLTAELARSMASNANTRSRSGTVAAGMGAMDAQAVNGTMIAFATAPGTVALDGDGRHSPFTQALLAHIETPDLDIDAMMKRVRGHVAKATNERQQPWTNSSLTAEYYLNPRSKAAPAGTAAASAAPAADKSPPPAPADKGGAGSSVPRGSDPAFDPRQMEFELWRAAQSSNSAAEYKAYLLQYPNGTFADIARTRIAALQSAAPSVPPPAPAPVNPPRTSAPPDPAFSEATAATEEALYLGPTQWKEAQRKLTAVGFSPKSTDGKPGEMTRKAVRDWQRSRQYPVTGFFNAAQLQALLAQPAVAKIEDDDDEEEDVKPRKQAAGKSSSTTRSVRRNDDEPPRRRSASRQSERSESSGSNSQLATGVIIGGVVGAVLMRQAIRRKR